jgi:hypothetical protein
MLTRSIAIKALPMTERNFAHFCNQLSALTLTLD